MPTTGTALNPSKHSGLTVSRAEAVNKLLDDYLVYLELTKNRSRLTVRNYRFYIQRFIKVMGLRHPTDIRPDIINRYRLLLNRWEETGKDTLSKSTQNYHLIAIRAFLKYLAKEGKSPLAPERVELMKIPERQVEFLEGSDLEALLAQPAKTKNLKVVQLRDRALLETLFSTGMRVSELVSLQRSQFNPKKEELSIRGKGRKIRVVFLSNQARYAIGQYLEARTDNAPNIFLRHDRAASADIAEDGKPLTPRSVERIIHRYAMLAGITKKVTPHTLRHSYATDLLMNGADIRSVQTMLGHASITTTQVYTHVTDQQLREVHKAFHGRKRKD